VTGAPAIPQQSQKKAYNSGRKSASEKQKPSSCANGKFTDVKERLFKAKS